MGRENNQDKHNSAPYPSLFKLVKSFAIFSLNVTSFSQKCLKNKKLSRKYLMILYNNLKA